MRDGLMTVGLAFWMLVVFCMIVYVIWHRFNEPPRPNRFEGDIEAVTRKRRYTRKRPVPIEKHAEARVKVSSRRAASTSRRTGTRKSPIRKKKKGLSWKWPFWR